MASESEQAVNSRAPAPGAVIAGIDLPEKMGRLEAKLERVQAEIEDLKKSDRSWAKKAGILIGVLGGVIAIPKIVDDAVKIFYNPPKTTIEWSRPLNISYDVHERMLRLKFPLVASNDGGTNDSIEGLSANLHSDAPQINSVPVSDSDIEIKEDEKSIPRPVPLGPGKTRVLLINLSLGSPFSEQALGFEGKRIVTVVLKMRNGKKVTNEYCFDFDQDQGREVLAAQEKHVTTPSCD